MIKKNMKSDREYYLDWIKVFVIVLLIPYHTAVSFSHIGHAYIFSNDVESSFLFIFISDFLNLWFMRILFFISGVATYIATKRKRTKNFVVDRIKRLLIPVLFLLLTIGPISGYILAVNHYNYTGSFLSFYPNFFLKPEQYLFWGHMWFCVYLLTFSLITIPLFIYIRSRTTIVSKISAYLVKGNNILAPMILIVLFEMIFRPFYPGLQSLIGDWANFSVHLSFFIFGFIMIQSTKLLNVISKKYKLFLLIGIFSTTLYIYIKRYSGILVDQYIVKIILSMLWGIAAYSWVMFVFGFSRIFFNITNKLLKYLSNCSFSLYIFHYLILTIFNYYLLKTSLNNHLIWIITSILTYITLILLFELILKRLRIFRFICGIKM